MVRFDSLDVYARVSGFVLGDWLFRFLVLATVNGAGGLL